MFTPPWDATRPYELVLDSDGGDRITQDGKTWEYRTGKLIKDSTPRQPDPVTPPPNDAPESQPITHDENAAPQDSPKE